MGIEYKNHKTTFDEYDRNTQYETWKHIDSLIKDVPLNNDMLNTLILMIDDNSQFIRGIGVSLLEEVVVRNYLIDDFAKHMKGWLMGLICDDYQYVREGAFNIINNILSNKRINVIIKQEYIAYLKIIMNNKCNDTNNLISSILEKHG